MRENNLPDIRRKVVLVSSAPGGHLVLANAKFEEQGGVLFLVGKRVYSGPTGDKSFDGKLCAVAWSAVSNYTVFGSRTEYRKAMASRAQLEKGLYRQLRDLTERVSKLEARTKKSR